MMLIKRKEEQKKNSDLKTFAKVCKIHVYMKFQQVGGRCN